MKILLLLLIALIIMAVCLYRINETFKLRKTMIDMVSKKAFKDVRNGIYDRWKSRFDWMPSYESMLFSFKSFKVENFLTEDQINELKS